MVWLFLAPLWQLMVLSLTKKKRKCFLNSSRNSPLIQCTVDMTLLCNQVWQMQSCFQKYNLVPRLFRKEPGNEVAKNIHLVSHATLWNNSVLHKCPMRCFAWTSDLKARSFNEPRLVYDLGGDIILVQSIYRCNHSLPDQTLHGHQYTSSSPQILEILPWDLKMKFPLGVLPFSMFTRSAVICWIT